MSVMTPKSFHFMVRAFWMRTLCPTWKSRLLLGLLLSALSRYLFAALCLAAAAFLRSVMELATLSGIGRAVFGLLARKSWAGEYPSSLGVALHSSRFSLNLFQEPDLARRCLHACTAFSATPFDSWW